MTLAGCDVLPPPEPSLTPEARPNGLASPRPAPRVQAPERSDASKALSVYYKRYENDLLVQGLLRQDGGGVDVPFGASTLVENFTNIAFFNEYTAQNGVLVSGQTQNLLRRWDQPIRMAVEFGPTVPQSQRRQDAANIAKYSRRLSRLTGVPIAQNSDTPNFVVMVVNEDDRLGFVPRVRSLVPGISDASLRAFADIPRSTFCLVLAFNDTSGSSSYTKAIAVIRGEHPDLLRLSCIHEEIAQGMGLVNDSPAARPSIFNDDEEFGLLTTHDEHLLKMLYNPRLSSGMTATQARPIIQDIAAELTGTDPNS